MPQKMASTGGQKIFFRGAFLPGVLRPPSFFASGAGSKNFFAGGSYPPLPHPVPIYDYDYEEPCDNDPNLDILNSHRIFAKEGLDIKSDYILGLDTFFRAGKQFIIDLVD